MNQYMTVPEVHPLKEFAAIEKYVRKSEDECGVVYKFGEQRSRHNQTAIGIPLQLVDKDSKERIFDYESNPSDSNRRCHEEHIEYEVARDKWEAFHFQVNKFLFFNFSSFPLCFLSFLFLRYSFSTPPLLFFPLPHFLHSPPVSLPTVLPCILQAEL